jgi:hypothetical protein
MEPSGGTDMVENLENVVSLRGTIGRSDGSPKFWTEGWKFMVVGSVAPLSWMAGGVSTGIVY